MDQKFREDILVAKNGDVLVYGKKSRRILSGAADFFLTMFLAMMLYPLFVQLVNVSPMGKAPEETLAVLSEESKKSGLQEWTKEGTTKTDDQLCYSYIQKITEYEEDTTRNDVLYRYYVNYESETKSCMSEDDFNVNILHAGEDSSLFAASSAGQHAILKSEIKTALTEYIAGRRTEAEVINTYRAAEAFFHSAYDVAWEEFATSKPYSSYLSIYADAATKRYVLLGTMGIVAYMASAFLFLWGVPLIKKKGTTIGKKILHFEPRYDDGNEVKVSAILIRGSIEILECIAAVPFVPMMVYGLDGFSLPFFVVNSFVLRLSVFFFVGFLFALVSVAMLLIRKDHKSFSGFVSQTNVYSSDNALISAARNLIDAEANNDAETN